MPMGDDPAISSFSWRNWDKKRHIKKCQNMFGKTPDYNWPKNNFDVSKLSNIIFTNGEFDPWSGGSIDINTSL